MKLEDLYVGMEIIRLKEDGMNRFTGTIKKIISHDRNSEVHVYWHNENHTGHQTMGYILEYFEPYKSVQFNKDIKELLK